MDVLVWLGSYIDGIDDVRDALYVALGIPALALLWWRSASANRQARAALEQAKAAQEQSALAQADSLTNLFQSATAMLGRYASGEYRLRESSGLSERARLGNGHRGGARQSREHDRRCRRQGRRRGRARRSRPGGGGARRRDDASSRRATVARSRPRRWRAATVFIPVCCSGGGDGIARRRIPARGLFP